VTRPAKRGVLSRLIGRGAQAEAVVEPLAVEEAPVAEALAAAAAAPSPPPGEPPARGGWLRRLTRGLARSSTALSSGIGGVFTKRRLDEAALAELEDLLIQADLGVATALEIATKLKAERFDKDIAPDEVRAFLAEEIAARLEPVAKPLVVDPAARPFVILVVGVNGSGKTTTIGKLAARFGAEGKSVLVAACDTFRAAAIEQLAIWGARAGAAVVRGEVGADAAGLAFDALARARADGTDILMIDTAGRLQNKADLMAELAKIVRVVGKQMPEAPHAVLLVLDATTGQNALAQARIFQEIAGVTGLVMTKLDGTARGGILVAMAAEFALPVHAIGVGETAEDLSPFAAADFARAIVGLEPAR
jgi:fused signal recognition particle receptor